jgi:type IX secretion system PorP/SprF family membrane protein
MKRIVLIAVCLCSVNTLFAQYEPMFTQYSFNEMFINPAYSGSHDALSVSALYRNQWVNIEGAPVTKTFTAHAPFANNKVGLGLTVYNDAIGVTNQSGAYFNYAYRIKMEESVLALGILGGVDGIQERLLDVRTTEGSDRQFAANTSMLLAPNFGTGLYFSNKDFYLSLSVPRLLQNKLVMNQNLQAERVTSNFNMEDLHYFMATGYVFTVNPLFKIKPSVMVKTVVNAPIEYDANLAFFMNNVLWLGAGYRSGDALNALIAVHPLPQLRIGYSYDYNLSTLRKYNAGSHEISVNYMFNYYKKRITSPRYF